MLNLGRGLGATRPSGGAGVVLSGSGKTLGGCHYCDRDPSESDSFTTIVQQAAHWNYTKTILRHGLVTPMLASPLLNRLRSLLMGS